MWNSNHSTTYMHCKSLVQYENARFNEIGMENYNKIKTAIDFIKYWNVKPLFIQMQSNSTKWKDFASSYWILRKWKDCYQNCHQKWNESIVKPFHCLLYLPQHDIINPTTFDEWMMMTDVYVYPNDQTWIPHKKVLTEGRMNRNMCPRVWHDTWKNTKRKQYTQHTKGQIFAWYPTKTCQLQ